jgi:hypothetical protein
MKKLVLALLLGVASTQGVFAKECQNWQGGVLSGKTCVDVSKLHPQRCVAVSPDGYTFEATAYTSDGRICGHGAGCMKGVKFISPCNLKSDLYQTEW